MQLEALLTKDGEQGFVHIMDENRPASARQVGDQRNETPGWLK